LKEKSATFRLRVAQLQNGLAIEKVVAREQLVEPDEMLAQHLDFRFVEILKKRRDRVGRQHAGEAGQQFGQFRTHFRQLIERAVRCRHPHLRRHSRQRRQRL
jgi:hypothetical protein